MASLIDQLTTEQDEANLLLAPLVERPNLVALQDSMDELVAAPGQAVA